MRVLLIRPFGCIEARCGRIHGTYIYFTRTRFEYTIQPLEYRYESVRKTLEDPAYHDWYIKFKPTGPWYSKKCDAVNTTDCTDLYHNQEQSPGYPHGDGDCGAPNCDCGNNVPCGFYVWNHSSTTVVNNQTFLEWFRDDYVFDYQGSSDLVSGMYFDDWWPESGPFPDPFPNMTEDMGLTPEEQKRISKSYQANMKVIYDEMLRRTFHSYHSGHETHTHTRTQVESSHGNKCGTVRTIRVPRTDVVRVPS